MAATNVAAAPEAPAHPSLREALQVWARVALLSFGGPAGQIAVMHHILVEEKRWISDRRFLHALNFCMLLPGPEAQQLATYVGWLLHGTRGGLLAGLLFILPGVVSIMLLSMVYAAYGSVGLVAALFFGLKAAVLAIVLEAVLRVGRRALRHRILVVLAAVSFVAIFVFAVPFPAVVLAAGVVGYLGGRAGWAAFAPGGHHGAGAAPETGYLLDDAMPTRGTHDHQATVRVVAIWLAVWLVPVAAVVAAAGLTATYSQIAIFFSKMAMVTFGGAYAVLAYVAQQAVETHGWLTAGEMLDGLGMAETTPGPLIMVLQFVGFLAAFRDPGTLPPMVAGVLGGLLATWVTFAPCFLWILAGAPYAETVRGNRALAGALTAITAAVVGVILNLAIWFAVHTLFRQTRPLGAPGVNLDVPVLTSIDPVALLLSAGAVVAVFYLKAGMLKTLMGCAAAGIIFDLVGVI
ncbi:MAG: chromate efflux transporter [Burkholderiales bacterium]|nr:chromate efflux transporter [Burkholderiales bacterium]